jgi:hypothetical protein
MMRIQEFYECANDEIRDNKFSLEKCLDHFSKDDGEFDYFEYWSGFNIPCNVIRKFYKLFKNDLLEKEIILFDKIKSEINNWKEDKRYYLIATLEKSGNTKLHEIAHGLWYTNEEYKELMHKELENIDTIKLGKIRTALKNMGYSELVSDDEVQAYLATENKRGLLELFDIELNLDETKNFKEILMKFYS